MLEKRTHGRVWRSWWKQYAQGFAGRGDVWTLESLNVAVRPAFGFRFAHPADLAPSAPNAKRLALIARRLELGETCPASALGACRVYILKTMY